MKVDYVTGFMCCHVVLYQPEIIALQVAQKWFERTGGCVGGVEQEFVLVHFGSDHFNTTATKYWSSA